MRILNWITPQGPRAAVLIEDRVVALPELSAPAWPSPMDWIAMPERLEEEVSRLRPTAASPTLDQVLLAAPIPRPEKIICIGRNYAEHAEEQGAEVPTLPVVFSKFASAVIGPGDPIRLPRISSQVDYEAELVVVIGKEGRNVPRDQAMLYVFGYMCGNDVTARDWQKGRPGGQWLLGKSFDTFAPTGPVIVSRDEVPDPTRLRVQCRLNGELMQDSTTDVLLFPIDFLIAHLSQFVTLRPGDLLLTGTPPGVGAARNPPIFLKPHDLVEVEISGLGRLTNPVT